MSDITGKVISILDAQRFVSKKDGKEYVRNAFVVETVGQYPKRICFTVMGDDRWQQMSILLGKSYNVSFDVESREWQGKWFTDCMAWKAVSLENNGGAPIQQAQTQQAQAMQPQPQPQNSNNSEQSSDLPF